MIADAAEARILVLHIHLDTTTNTTTSGGGVVVLAPTGRLEHGQHLVLLDQIRSWCADSHTRITLRPVIDLNVEKTVDGYAIPDRIRDHVILRDRTCMFPWCTRPARGCDLDHVIAYDPDGPPGQTSTTNLVPLCRFHHRLKTHTPWHSHMPTPGTLHWTSPHGHTYTRDHTGTRTGTHTSNTGPPRP